MTRSQQQHHASSESSAAASDSAASDSASSDSTSTTSSTSTSSNGNVVVPLNHGSSAFNPSGPATTTTSSTTPTTATTATATATATAIPSLLPHQPHRVLPTHRLPTRSPPSPPLAQAPLSPVATPLASPARSPLPLPLGPISPDMSRPLMPLQDSAAADPRAGSDSEHDDAWLAFASSASSPIATSPTAAAKPNLVSANTGTVSISANSSHDGASATTAHTSTTATTPLSPGFLYQSGFPLAALVPAEPKRTTDAKSDVSASGSTPQFGPAVGQQPSSSSQQAQLHSQSHSNNNSNNSNNGNNGTHGGNHSTNIPSQPSSSTGNAMVSHSGNGSMHNLHNGATGTRPPSYHHATHSATAYTTTFPPIIHLNVGGQRFSTSLETLTGLEPDSMLAAMFSGDFPIRQDPDGCYFIDRDGTHFRHILNYLRYGRVHIALTSLTRDTLMQLREEADFFQLRGLLQLLPEGRDPSVSALTQADLAFGRHIVETVTKKVQVPEYFVARESLLEVFRSEANRGNLIWQRRLYHHNFIKHPWQPLQEPNLRSIMQHEFLRMGLELKYTERLVLGTSEKFCDFEGSVRFT